jgi:hypothetical protein
LLGNLIALDVRQNPLAPKNTGRTSDGADGVDGADNNSSVKPLVCVSLLSAFALQKSQFPCGFCGSDPEAFANVTEFCVLKGFWANAVNQTAIETDYGWMGKSPFCQWIGVTCNDEGRVTGINLKHPYVPTTLPLDVGDLKSLETLLIVGNGDLPNGPIPDGLFQLSNLTTLSLQSTSVKGPLPDTFDKTSLKSL